MSREIIYAVVIIVFGYIIGRYKLLPYFAAKKILKDAKKDRQDNGTAAQQPPSLPPQIPYTMPYSGYPVALPHPQPEKPSRRDMYFDCRLVGIDSEHDDYTKHIDSVGDAVNCAASDILISLRNRGICPDSLGIVPLSDGLLLVYVTYIL